MELHKFETRKPDGRLWIQYSRRPFPADFKVHDPGLLRPSSWTPPVLRYNAMRGDWVAISASRNDRPMLPPKEYCPLCPQHESHDARHTTGSGTSGAEPLKTEIPVSRRTYEWAVFENMFPALAEHPEGFGRCEVILYSPSHESTLGAETVSHIQGLVHVWQDRSRSVGAIPGIEQVFLFENKGAEVGVTLHHPHGQLYSFPQVPPFLAAEHREAREFHAREGGCLICDLARRELTEKSRVVIETEHIVAYVPFAARYPYEVHVTTKAHRPLIESLTEAECGQLALVMKRIIHKYDNLFGFRMPYILAHHQSPAKRPDDPTYHWHIEFYPPYRGRNKLKYLAGVESGAGFFVNDTVPETKAQELRDIETPF